MIDHLSELHPCPVCGYLTLGERSAYEICPVCFWEDDGFDENPDEVLGGPNGDLSLTMARKHFADIGAVEVRLLAYVRPPEESELAAGLPSADTIAARQENGRVKFNIRKDDMLADLS